MPNAAPSQVPLEYREWEAPPGLTGVVSCLWTRGPQQELSTAPRAVLPDNSIDVIWRFYPDGAVNEALVVGAMSRPFVPPPDAHNHYVGVRFAPGFAASVLRIGAQELRDDRVALSDVMPTAHAWPALPWPAAADTVAAAVRRALQPAVERAASPPARLREALQLARASAGRTPVDALARAVGVSRQFLGRLFDAHVGLNPKLVARVLRMEHVMTRALRTARVARAKPGGQASTVSWSILAAEAGYADQSHLITDFLSLAGVSPAEWLASRV